MRPNEAHELFEGFEYPLSLERLAEATADCPLAAPAGTTETVGEVLRRADVSTVHSTDDACLLLFGHLGAAHVGRRRYDDRSANLRRSEAHSI